MTEAEWLACDEPGTMLEVLRGKASDRKLQLYCVASVCVAWSKSVYQANWVEDPGTEYVARLVDALAGIVRFADGLASFDEMRGKWLAQHLANPTARVHPEHPFDWAVEFIQEDTDTVKHFPTRSEMAFLLREIFGNPFRPVTFSPAWRTDTAVSLARTMYDAREFSAMPILADALQDAGCDNDDILNHCRGDGPHVRGCWVVDLVLGKE
jgi:hypothetical protein